MRMIICLIIVFIISCLQGCIAPREVIPAVKGKVINSKTKVPIANASVYFEGAFPTPFPPTASTTTNAVGEYSLERRRELAPFLIGDPSPTWGTLTIKKEGCSDYSIKTGENPTLDIELDCAELPKQ